MDYLCICHTVLAPLACAAVKAAEFKLPRLHTLMFPFAFEESG